MSTYRVFAAFYASRSVPQYIKECRAVVDKVGNSAYLQNPNPPLAKVSVKIDALEAAELATLHGPRGSVATRDVAYIALQADMRQLVTYVQSCADANATCARDVIEGAGLYAFTRNRAGKALLGTRPGAGLGCAEVVAKAFRGNGTYHWQMSENQVDWTDLDPTVACTTAVTGLVLGKVYWFRFRTFTKAGYSEWSSPVTYIPH